jgi:uroporphyrinogen-III decarboxylase
MREDQWKDLLALLSGKELSSIPCGFIIDSPWLPNWAGMSRLDYMASEELWFRANLKANREFPECWFFPGFWSEFGMCSEPSAFGAEIRLGENDFPFPAKILPSLEDVSSLPIPDPRTDGLLPLIRKRLVLNRGRLEEEGHPVRFAVSRGPLNIASFIAGTTEFLTAVKSEPERVHQLLDKTTAFVAAWLEVQREDLPTIDGLLILDDIVGFLGDEDFREFALPHLKKLFKDSGVAVRFFHNDSPCLVSAPYLEQCGINLFNLGMQHSLQDIRERAGSRVTLMGNVPSVKVMAEGTPQDVKSSVRQILASLKSSDRVILSCAGGMPPGVPTENIRAFAEAAHLGRADCSDPES